MPRFTTRAEYFNDTILQYILLLIAFAVTLFANAYVRGTSNKYSKVPAACGKPGRQAAAEILRSQGLYRVSICSISGNMTDHYDPRSNTVALAAESYNQSTVTGIAVAAHECGHAIQHATGYGPLKIRTAIAPVVSFANSFSWILIVIGIIFALTPVTYVGIALFSAILVFQLVTLPVEFNASGRALRILQDSGTLTAVEMKGARKVLRAAALTYVASMTTSVLTLFRLLLIAKRDD